MLGSLKLINIKNIIIATAGLILLSGNSIIYCRIIKNYKETEKYKCRIEERKNNSRLILTASFKNNDKRAVKISYEFNTYKSGISGNSSDTQSGIKIVKSNSGTVLSRVGFDFGKSDIYKAYLKILKGKVIVSRDSLIINRHR